ncbi:MAG: tetratricopeptide repeat protein, partial [Gammaproteobacteria bacterium]|nr:tetratricopeptide repeat protein [Gammaproteobacteria bacterium]
RDLKPEEAIDSFRKALELKPHYVDAQFNLANTYKEQGQLEEAKETYQLVLSQQPNHIGATVNLAVIMGWEGNFTDALDLLKRAEAEDASNYVLQNNLGMIYHLLQNFEAAKNHYQKALQLNDNPEVRWNLALTCLAEGDFAEGFRLFESRWQIPHLNAGVKRNFTRREWKGENITGKTLLVYFEQGYGDAIQFCRFLPSMLNKGASVILQVPQALKALMETLDERLQIITDVNEAGDFDYHCSLMSLAGNLRVKLNTIPAEVPYFHVAKSNSVTEITAPQGVLKVGVVWAGNPRAHDVQTNMIDRRRSCDPQLFEEMANSENVNLYSLQFDRKPPLGSKIIDAMQGVSDFKQTAEIIQQLDLVISVDTAVAHLAGALGKPVWLLSRYDACWRWMKGRDDSPWYPSMKIYRQLEPGDWQPVFEEVKQALENYQV